MKNLKGFTLIELLIVVAIVGVITAIGVTAYNQYIFLAKASATKTQHATITRAISAKASQCKLGHQVESYNSAGQVYKFNCPTDINTFKRHMDYFIYGGGFTNPYGNSNGSRCRLNVYNCSPPGYANSCIGDRGMMGLRLDAGAGIIESCSAYLTSSSLEYMSSNFSVYQSRTFFDLDKSPLYFDSKKFNTFAWSLLRQEL